jgi:periplasmic divalent cation tolerance protein
MTTEDLCEVTITAPDPMWFEDLCRELIEQRLASSARVVREVTSIYRWEGAVRERTEARAFLRSRTELLDNLVALVVERHPYEVPNISALPVIGGNPAYLGWVRAETQQPTDVRQAAHRSQSGHSDQATPTRQRTERPFPRITRGPRP